MTVDAEDTSLAEASGQPMDCAPDCSDATHPTIPTEEALRNSPSTTARICPAAGAAPSVCVTPIELDLRATPESASPSPSDKGAEGSQAILNEDTPAPVSGSLMLDGAGSLPAESGLTTGTTTAEQPHLLEALLARLLAMCTGAGEAPRVSGLPTVCDRITSGLCIDVSDVVAKAMGTPKKPGPHRTEMIRCCGQLDKEEARGWLVNDAIGRPLLHRNDERGQNSAREVGKRVAHAATAAESSIKAAKAAASTAKSKAKTAAAKDPTQLPAVAAAVAAGEAAVAALRAEDVDLNLPEFTVGPARSTTDASVLRELAEKQAVLDHAAADLARAEERVLALTTATNLAMEKVEKAFASALPKIPHQLRVAPGQVGQQFLQQIAAYERVKAERQAALQTLKAALDYHERAALSYEHATAALGRYIAICTVRTDTLSAPMSCSEC
jgi:hypothetical protein